MLRFSIPRMSCGHCASTITTAVKALDTKAEIETDLPAQEIRVRSTANAHEITEALLAVGYESEALAA